MKYRKKTNYHHHAKLWNSALVGQNLILDFSFSNDCLNSEHNSILSQTRRIIDFNCESDRPFNLWFTSLKKDSKIYDKFQKTNLITSKHFINQTETHFIDLFPKDKLVYLSPDAEDTIDKFDRNSIYILGAVVDRYEDNPLTCESAKQLNIKSFKLPLKDHVILTELSLDLSFYNVFQMLNYMQLDYACWKKRVSHVLTNGSKEK